MILIISENNDLTTDKIICWLLYLNKPFIRINDTDKVSILNLKISNDDKVNFDLEVLNRIIPYKSIVSVYYRRGRLNINNFELIEHSSNKQLNLLINKEIQTLLEFVHYALELKKSIGSFKNRSLNKLKVLHLAKKIGLNVPESYVINNKKDLIRNPNNLISKHLYETAMIINDDENNYLSSKTYRVEEEEINDSKDFFLYSLFQKEIEKEFEVRAFYLDGDLYAVAMFTQKNMKTQIDFRNYDAQKPTRTIPFILPKIIQDKIKKLFKLIDLDTGSVDLISNNNKFYFLEINPVGQYSMISEPCNLNLEKIVATKL